MREIIIFYVSNGMIVNNNTTKVAKSGFYSAPCTGIFSRFDFSFPCNFYICKSCGTTNIPLDQENCGACSLLSF